jgi:hypothetical protein
VERDLLDFFLPLMDEQQLGREVGERDGGGLLDLVLVLFHGQVPDGDLGREGGREGRRGGGKGEW